MWTVVPLLKLRTRLIVSEESCSFVALYKVFATTIGVVLCWMWKGNRFAPLGFAIAYSPPVSQFKAPRTLFVLNATSASEML
jgi:hypothetical protein